MAYQPKYDIATYRKFIKDAAPFVSLVIGRKIHASESDLLSDEAMIAVAEKIDARVKDLNASIEANKTNGFPFPAGGVSAASPKGGAGARGKTGKSDSSADSDSESDS